MSAVPVRRPDLRLYPRAAFRAALLRQCRTGMHLTARTGLVEIVLKINRRCSDLRVYSRSSPCGAPDLHVRWF